MKTLLGLNILTVRIITVALIITEKCFLGVLLRVFSEATIFENGYSGLEKTDVNLEAKTSNTTCTIIDKNGKVYGTYSNVTAYGYGYTVVETYTSGYKEAYYQYDIYSPSGEIVYTYNTETNEKASVGYHGEGVFCIRDNNEKVVYFAKKEK